jgi:sulfite reductase alpha subunit-like flavoprotein
MDTLLHKFEEDAEVLISDSTKAHGNDAAVQRFKDEYPTIVDFLEEYIDVFCKPIYLSTEKHDLHRTPIISIADVLVLMPNMKDRFYSISSSDVLSPNKLSITVGLYQRETSEGVIEKGTCSSYLKSLSPGTYFDARIV